MALPAGDVSLDEADAAIELWEHYKKRTLDLGQRLDVYVMMATRPDGLWAADTTGHEKPRQNGKGDSIEVVELWDLTQRASRIGHTLHDAVLLATETQSRMLGLLESHADLRRLKARAWRGTGQQMIELRNGGIIWYRTRTGSGLRGIDEVDRIVVDEAQHAELEHISSITPTQATSANPQLNALGTGGLEGKSGWWWSLRKQTKRNVPARFGYVGFSAQPWDIDDEGRVTLGDVDPTDKSAWWDTNEALHSGRISEEYLDRQLRLLGPVAFAQEHLCVWAPPPDEFGDAVIPLDRWRACEDHRSGPVGQVQFGIAVSFDRAWACIAVAAESGAGGVHGEITGDEHHLDYRRGTEWVATRARELQDRWGGSFAIANGSPAASLETELTKAGVNVATLTTAEHAQACADLYDSVVQTRFRHLGQPALNVAVSGADRRFSGDSWLWSQRNSSTDIAPLSAITLAKWLHEQGEEAAPEPFVMVG